MNITSKDRLECIVADLTPKAKEQNKEDIEILARDLEVLEILKKYIKINNCKFEKDNKVKKCIIMLIPEMVEDYRVIKEWLENE